MKKHTENLQKGTKYMRRVTRTKRIKTNASGQYLIDVLDNFLRRKHTKSDLEKKKGELLRRYAGNDAAGFEKVVKLTIFLHKLYDSGPSVSKRQIDRICEKTCPTFKNTSRVKNTAG